MRHNNPLSRITLRLCGAVLAASVVLLASCGSPQEQKQAEDAAALIKRAEPEWLSKWVAAERAEWVRATYINFDTSLIASQAQEGKIETETRLAREAARFKDARAPEDVARKLKILRTLPTLPAPADPKKTEELAKITTALKSAYGSGKYCREGGSCRSLDELEAVMASSRDPAELLDAWTGWRTVSAPMRPDFKRYVELANEGARELGFADLGALWRSNYDMTPDEFAADYERIWQQVKPLYVALHCYGRAKLAERYGTDLVPPGKPIPAHLVGNMWAQDWVHIAELLEPGDVNPGYDLTAVLRKRGMDATEMVRTGERFFTSLGFEPLPETFWQRSMLLKPRDRDVVCHASAWDVDMDNDLRLKMCIKIDEEDFNTVHHELGHVFYDQSYRHLDPLFRNSANGGFNEALGDTIGLSITPHYLMQIGLLDSQPKSNAVAMLMHRALDKVVFLPFGVLMDEYRWKVFSGEIPPEKYNTAWWDMIEKYQGVRPPVERTEAQFDPGAKYHIANNVSYERYFLATVLQFQFHRALCEAAGFKGPLHECSIYGNAEVGRRLRDMMTKGRSRPWPDALEALTGSRQVDATAMLDYFAPLKTWLDEQNAGQTCGW